MPTIRLVKFTGRRAVRLNRHKNLHRMKGRGLIKRLSVEEESPIQDMTRLKQSLKTLRIGNSNYRNRFANF